LKDAVSLTPSHLFQCFRCYDGYIFCNRFALTYTHHANKCSNYALNAAANGNIANEIVTIKVGTGEAQTSFQWLRSILEFHSSFFTGALERSFKEAQSREIEMPQDNPDVFAEFVRWITDHRRKHHERHKPRLSIQ